MFPATNERVPNNTTASVNEQIHQETAARVSNYRRATSRLIQERLEELEHEWDVERVLEANAAALAFTGCVLSAAASRRWLILPIAVTGFLFQHAVQGWCPPLPILRRLGVRTLREIDEERNALVRLLNNR